jgi:hypothetical protein
MSALAMWWLSWPYLGRQREGEEEEEEVVVDVDVWLREAV